MELATAVGLLAGTLTTIAYVPQVVKSWRTGSTADISLTMFAIMVSGVTLWLIYGAFVRDIPIVIANGATLLLAGTVLVLKIKNG
ncbi:MAG TPA: SemiSWEET transporter [Hyphomicrobium sp.]|nr:SemiSWEET transporter [Hyphomicrobium sp.]